MNVPRCLEVLLTVLIDGSCISRQEGFAPMNTFEIFRVGCQPIFQAIRPQRPSLIF